MNIWQRLRLALHIQTLRSQLHTTVRAVVPSDFGCSDFLATHTQLKKILARRISPELEAEGYFYDGRYLWYGPWEERCRKVVRVGLSKGAGAVFMWGLCFDFLPVFGWDGKKVCNIHYQRTDKAVDLQLFTTPPTHSPLGRKPSVFPCRFSLFGKDLEDVEAQTVRAFQEARPLFGDWFQETAGLSGALEEAKRQAADPYNCNWPAPGYVLAFLLAASGQGAEASAALETYFARWEEHSGVFPPDERAKLEQKLRTLGNPSTESRA